MAELLGLRPREIDARECALEVVSVAGKLHRNERAAARRRRRAELEAKLGEDAAQLARLALVALLHLAQCQGLALLDAIERSLDAVEPGVDGDVCVALAARRRAERLERCAVVRAPGRRERVTGRRRLCAGRVRAARGAADRSGRGRIGNAAERRRVRFQRGLAAGQLLELPLELLLVEQLSAGGAIDLRAQLGEAVFVGELLLGLARDESSEHVVAEREIGRSRD